jgi:threonine/homoserine/homoserine lactone efflux protein
MVAVVMMVVILPSATVWAGAGGAMSRLLSSERTHGIVSIGLAVMLAVTVVLVWI